MLGWFALSDAWYNNIQLVSLNLLLASIDIFYVLRKVIDADIPLFRNSIKFVIILYSSIGSSITFQQKVRCNICNTLYKVLLCISYRIDSKISFIQYCWVLISYPNIGNIITFQQEVRRCNIWNTLYRVLLHISYDIVLDSKISYLLLLKGHCASSCFSPFLFFIFLFFLFPLPHSMDIIIPPSSMVRISRSYCTVD